MMCDATLAAPAPLLPDDDLTLPDATAHWLTTADGVRLRIGVLARGTRGTVLCFPGRTEYIEKYGRVAAHFAAQGLGTVAIDWRGQGLADRLAADPLLGHVGRFDDYQHDVRAYLDYAGAQEMPKPWYLLAHSMGGAIGLRAVHEGLPVHAAAFSAPMWGLTMTSALRPLAKGLPGLADLLGLEQMRVPGTSATPYVLEAAVDDNLLTSDPESFLWFRNHVKQNPDLALGAPTMRWLGESMREFARFQKDPAPSLRCRIHLGLNERIVCPVTIRHFNNAWPTASLMEHPGAEHEVLMERPDIRNAILTDLSTFFSDP